MPSRMRARIGDQSGDGIALVDKSGFVEPILESRGAASDRFHDRTTLPGDTFLGGGIGLTTGFVKLNGLRLRFGRKLRARRVARGSGAEIVRNQGPDIGDSGDAEKLG